MKNKRNFSSLLSSCLAFLIPAAIGFFSGYAILDYVTKLSYGRAFYISLLAGAAGLICLALALVLQILIHEAGHLLFGLISGYDFVSFRVGSFMLMRDGQGKLSLKRYSLPGTAGQCLMSPPDFEEDGYLPVGLYNMGGVMLNVISALFFFWAYYLSGGAVILPMFFMCLGITGLGLGLMNGLPLGLSGINTDGYNALSLGRDETSLRSFWIQLKINQALAEGQRLGELPEDWFKPAPEESRGFGAYTDALRASRLLETQQLSEALELIDRLLERGRLPGIYVNLLNCDRLYLLALKGQAPQPDKALDKFMEQMKKFPSVLRTRYALALSTGDREKAQEYRKLLESMAPSYPYSGDLASDLELVELAERSLTSPAV